MTEAGQVCVTCRRLAVALRSTVARSLSTGRQSTRHCCFGDETRRPTSGLRHADQGGDLFSSCGDGARLLQESNQCGCRGISSVACPFWPRLLLSLSLSLGLLFAFERVMHCMYPPQSFGYVGAESDSYLLRTPFIFGECVWH